MRLDRRSVGLTLAALAAAGGIGAAAVVGLGLYDVSARAGHLPGVSWILHTTFRRSVALRAPLEAPPADLDTPGMIALGAAHYDAACRLCHAGPGLEKTATIRAMVPEPPHVTEAVGDWSAGELHWILREGVKMSGMPHWPSARLDDIWPVVAFLRAVEAMPAEEYARLTAGPAGPGDATAAYCSTCHGADGVSGNGHVPRLDILSERYMGLALEAYRSGNRESGIMRHAASEVDARELARMAARFAATEPAGAATEGGALAEAGEALALDAVAADVPACASCHGPWPEPLNDRFPALSGQYAPYLAAQLRLWRDGVHGGSDAARLMYEAARDLDDAEVEALAAYYASLPPAKLDAGD